MLKRIGIDCQPGAKILEQTILGSRRISFGARCFVSVRCILDGSDWIRIGDDVHLAPGVSVLTSTHEIGPSERRAGRLITAPTTIGRGAWIGAGVTINPGVTIGDGCVVASGAVVTKDCEPDTLYAGVPAMPVRKLTNAAAQP